MLGNGLSFLAFMLTPPRQSAFSFAPPGPLCSPLIAMACRYGPYPALSGWWWVPFLVDPYIYAVVFHLLWWRKKNAGENHPPPESR
jgi:hypothetical protein